MVAIGATLGFIIVIAAGIIRRAKNKDTQ